MEVGKRYVLTVESKQEIPDVEKDPAFDISSLAVKTNISDLATEHDHYQNFKDLQKLLYYNEGQIQFK